MGELRWEMEGDDMCQLRIDAVVAMKFEDFGELEQSSNYAEHDGGMLIEQLLIPLAVLKPSGEEMACSVGEEQWLISSGGQRKYGATSTHATKPERLIRYDVQENDTLQGIALKYNVTMEQLKRANKLWTNDSLRVRRTLLVPLPLEPSGAACSDSDDSISPCCSSSESRQPAAGATTPASGDNFGVPRTAADFLKQVDSVIASSRRNVSRLQLD